MDGHSTVRFPGESASYRAARDELLAAERDLRKQVEQVAQLRRKLPLGGELPEDYAFEEGAADLADTTAVVSVKVSDLFRKGHVCADCGTTFEPATRLQGGVMTGVIPPDPLPGATDPTTECARCTSNAVYSTQDGAVVCGDCGALLTLEITQIAPGTA